MKNNIQSDRSEAIKNNVASKFANYILQVQLLFDERMKNLTVNWTKRQQLLFLYGICLALGGLSLANMLSSGRVQIPLKSAAIKEMRLPVKHPQKQQLIITDEEFRQLKEYKQQHPELKQSRPGLFDSLALVEEMYYSQKK